MIMGTRNRLNNLKNVKPFKIFDTDVKYVRQYNYLVVIIDGEMSLVPLCKNVEKRMIDKVYMLRKVRRHLTYHASLQIY